MEQQTKAKLMELFSEALDKGAYVNVHFTQYDKTNGDWEPVFKKDVEDKAKELAELLSVKVDEKSVGLSVAAETVHLCFSYIEETEYMVDDVFLEEDAI